MTELLWLVFFYISYCVFNIHSRSFLALGVSQYFWSLLEQSLTVTFDCLLKSQDPMAYINQYFGLRHKTSFYPLTQLATYRRPHFLSPHCSKATYRRPTVDTGRSSLSVFFPHCWLPPFLPYLVNPEEVCQRVQSSGRMEKKHRNILTWLLLLSDGLTFSGRGRLTDCWALLCLVSFQSPGGIHDTAPLFSSRFHIAGFAQGPPHTCSFLGSHAFSRLSSWAGFKMFPV